ncbi:hypothetical protein [Streptomyces sp. NPDC046909]|uniref:hypothetical protein n=1 Tax=Streptomyces sp. NPDC046909 TaxID=3155617 RepID=UPI0033CDB0E1
MDDNTTLSPPQQPPTPPKDRTVHGAVIGGACTILAAVIGYLALPAVATPPTASVPTETQTVTSRVTVTATVTQPSDGQAASTGTPAAPSGTALPSSEGWVPEFSDRVSLEAAWTNLDKFPPSVGSLSDVQVVGHLGGIYLRTWKEHVMAKVPAGTPDPAPAACGDLIDASAPASNRLTVATGDRLCLRTDRARIALLTLTSTQSAGADSSSAVAHVTVWTGPDTPSY